MNKNFVGDNSILVFGDNRFGLIIFLFHIFYFYISVVQDVQFFKIFPS